MKKMKTLLSSSLLAAMVALSLGSAVQATQPVNIVLSTVGNPNNAADTTVMNDSTTGYGQVNYTFNIGTYDVTLTQYTSFLNAVAQTDTYSLYNPSMATDLNIAGIRRSGSPGSYAYTVLGDGQRPVTYVSWFDAARFCNWLNNGEPATHVEDASTTEAGAYTLSGTMSGVSVSKNLLAQWYIPSENEWYKAAYYDPTLNSGIGGYWGYATRSNTAPGNVIGGLENQANYQYGSSHIYSATLSSIYSGSQNYLSDVGAFTNSRSAYGTYDQSGDVFNWNDAVIGSFSYRGLLGGAWNEYSASLESSARGSFPSTFEYDITGFRVANAAPEPNCIMLIGLGGILLASVRRKTAWG